MPLSDIPSLNLAIARLANTETNNFAIWVLKAPYPAGYVHHDCTFPTTLTSSVQAWQAMFAPHTSPPSAIDSIFESLPLSPDWMATPTDKTIGKGGRLMQHLGISLWQWLFQRQIQISWERSIGIAIGQDKPLRVRLDIREPNLIALPWEIMQPQSGKPAISLAQQVLFSRTTSDVEPLPPLPSHQGLNILLVLGENSSFAERLQLEKEAQMLEQTLKKFQQVNSINGKNLASVPCRVDTLLQPTPKQLISQLETQAYNIFFYSGHGLSAPDGGMLFLRSGMTLSGTELAQVLTRSQVTLCAINACWGALPAFEQEQALPRSSLAEVLIHHGVPAVLGMRDEIADEEALSFIQAFTQALAAGTAIDRAVAVARQQLLALYRFNHPAWTLPVLYMHPEFDGELLSDVEESITQLPEDAITGIGEPALTATLRDLSTPEKAWHLRNRLVRLGRHPENDIVIPEVWVSQRHAEIYCRQAPFGGTTFFLRDNSRFGTLLVDSDRWVHSQEVALQSGMRLKFGSSKGQTFEFIVES